MGREVREVSVTSIHYVKVDQTNITQTIMPPSEEPKTKSQICLKIIQGSSGGFAIIVTGAVLIVILQK